VAILNKGKLALEGKISNLIAGRGYRVMVSALPDRALDEIRLIASSIARSEEAIEIQAADRENANAIIDKVRSSGGFVESMTSSTSSLEEVFIRTTRSEAK
jgi:ABC-type uncharacterized transport system ATPase subunit